MQKTRIATINDVLEIEKLISRVEEDKEVFIKNQREEIKFIVEEGLSFVYEEDGFIKGLLLIRKHPFRVDTDYIDTIVSLQAGIGSTLLSLLPPKRYAVHISPKNKRSRCLFHKFGFKFKRVERIYGLHRGLYVGYIGVEENDNPKLQY